MLNVPEPSVVGVRATDFGRTVPTQRAGPVRQNSETESLPVRLTVTRWVPIVARCTVAGGGGGGGGAATAVAPPAAAAAAAGP